VARGELAIRDDVVAPKEEGEEELNSIEASGISSYATEYRLEGQVSSDLARETAKEIMETIKSKVVELSPEFVGHIKLFIESDSNTIKTNLTAFDQEITMEVIDNVAGDVPRLKVLSAVSSIDREKLVNIVNETISDKLGGRSIAFSHSKPHDHDPDHGRSLPVNLINNN
jgi:hypothetical protein